MGKLYDSILSGTSGRTGRIVVANVHGNEYSRIRPRKRTSPPSAKQALIQQRLKDSTLFMQSYKNFACKYFGQRSGAKSPYNQATTNLLDSFQLDYPNNQINIQYPSIAFAKGNLLAPIAVMATITQDQDLKFSWQDNSAGDPTREQDLMQILIAPDQELDTVFLENAAQRRDQSYTLALPNYLQSKTLHLYVAFKSQDNTQASNSIYIGSVS